MGPLYAKSVERFSSEGKSERNTRLKRSRFQVDAGRRRFGCHATELAG